MCTGAAQEFIKYLLYTCLFNYLKPRLASIKNNILLSGVCQYDPVLHKLHLFTDVITLQEDINIY